MGNRVIQVESMNSASRDAGYNRPHRHEPGPIERGPVEKPVQPEPRIIRQGNRSRRGRALARGSFLSWRIPRAALALIFLLAVPAALAQTEAPRFEVTKYTIEAELFPSTH